MASIFGKFKKKKGQDGSAEKSKSPSQSQGQAPKGGSKGGSSNGSNSNVSSDGKVRGILRNKKDAEKYHNNDSFPTSDDLDESLRNARKNMAINLDVSKKDKNKDKANGNVIEDISEPSPSKGKEVVSDGSLQEAAKKVNQETDNMISSNNNNDNNEMNNNNDNNDNKDNNDSNNNNKNENDNNNNEKNENESKTDNDIDMTGQKKDVLWDEDNLRQNEEEKVPRMKIDEAPTPYHDMPDELMDGMDGLEHHSEEILDINPMDMATDDTESHSQQARSSSVNSNDANHKLNNDNSNEDPANTNKQLQMERQAALLQSSEYRDKMINDALQRRDDDIAKNTEKKKKVIQSAWEEDDPNSKNKNETASDDTSDNSMKKQDFKKKRAAHYNEFYAVKAMKEKMNQDNYDDDE